MSQQDSLSKLLKGMNLNKSPKQSPPKQSRKRRVSASPKNSMDALMAQFTSMGLTTGKAKKSRTTKMTASNVKAMENAAKFVGSTSRARTRAQTRGGPSAMEDVVRPKKARASRTVRMSEGGTGAAIKNSLQKHINGMMNGGRSCHNCNEEQNGGSDIMASIKKMSQMGGRRR
jgi:hypothetical protein